MTLKKFKLLFLIGVLCVLKGNAQTTDFKNPALKYYLNPEKTRFIQFSGYMEFWARYSELNPGSLVNDQPEKGVYDFSIRRIRAKMTMRPTEKLTVVLQMGPSNVNVNSKSNTYMDLLDAYAEYKFSDYISVGGGRSTWTGLSRFSTGPLATLLYDMPAFATANAGNTDVTVRKLGIYVKGQIGKLDYRMTLADPYTDGATTPKLNTAVFNTDGAHQLVSGYFKYQFLDKESNETPFSPGTYLGKKRVFNIGIGAEYMADALWHTTNSGEVVHDAMKNMAIDVFYDTPIDKDRGTSFSAYAIALKNDYGPNFIRNIGTNNPATGVDATAGSFNGAGNAYPVVGTGNTYYAQIGGTLPYFDHEKKGMQLMPAASVQYSTFDRLADPVVVYDAGVTLLFNGHSSKMTFDAQRRPVFGNVASLEEQPSVTAHRMTYLLKYRIDFN
ncbi:hypothetical protein KHA90_00235 [Flavobacterium psychroterrae]|uniref:Porin n=1 Tax=Flavobacterium psychroterrae TaxID=2133767 RepID=A0ABS5P583_9FLAO|nr:hypothetical protein [Flavobacterium psychroterrae]MBS7229439.1 hypothetical protein [Flavobacterium psychroterrae]